MFVGLPDDGKLSIRQVDLVYSDPDGAYVTSGVEEGELAVVSPIQAPFDGMNITVMQRMEDGSIKVYERKSSEDTSKTDETAELAQAGDGDKGVAQ